MDFADDAEDLTRDGPDVVDGGEDLAADAEDFPGEADDFDADEAEADGFEPEGSEADRFHPAEPEAQGFGAQEFTAAAGGQAVEYRGGLREVPEEPAEPRPSTGEPRVDAALARLDELEGRPVTEHRAVFEDVHRRLRDVLGELDSRQQPQSPDATDAAGRPGR